MPRPKGHRRKWWASHQWTPPVTPAGGPSPWAETEQWLSVLKETGTIVAISGASGVWEVTTAHGHRVTVTAERDAEMREAAAILGNAR